MRNQVKTGGRSWTILELIRWTAGFFKSHNIESPRPSAEILLAHCLGMNRVDLYVNFDKPLTGPELDRYRGFVKRRANREPAAYITGRKEFWSLDLTVTPDVLIPRPETEHLVEACLAGLSDRQNPPQRILELGVGSGAVILALAGENPEHLFFASDRSPKALAVAKKNAIDLFPNQQIHFFAGDWFDPLSSEATGFDIIVSNPPYVKTSDLSQLEPEIRQYEPAAALDGKEDGLSAIRRIVVDAPEYLNHAGELFIEIGYDQKEPVRRIVHDSGRYENLSFIKDYAGRDRIVRMIKKEV